jgi:hemolysin activation/secretion protein
MHFRQILALTSLFSLSCSSVALSQEELLAKQSQELSSARLQADGLQVASLDQPSNQQLSHLQTNNFPIFKPTTFPSSNQQLSHLQPSTRQEEDGGTRRQGDKGSNQMGLVSSPDFKPLNPSIQWGIETFGCCRPMTCRSRRQFPLSSSGKRFKSPQILHHRASPSDRGGNTNQTLASSLTPLAPLIKGGIQGETFIVGGLRGVNQYPGARYESPNPHLAQNNPNIPPGILEPTRPSLPPLPATPQGTPTPPPQLTPPPETPQTPPPQLGVTVQVKRIEVLGSTVFSPAQLEAAVASFIGKDATFEELLAIRTVITQLYTDKGYTTSGAFLPPQDVTDGVVQVQVVEGAIEKIEIQGLKRLRTSYVRSRIGLAAKPPVNLRRLEEALQLLQLDPHISTVQAELSAGTSPGLSVLTLNVKEAQPLTTALIVENRNSPSVGSIQGTAAISHNNLLGFGDRLSAEYGMSEGVNSYNISYEIPLNPRDGTLSISYDHSSSQIIEKPFSDFDINSNSYTLSLGFRQPIIRTPTSEFSLALSLDSRQSETFLLEEIPFSFSPGPDNGKSQVTALRFTQDWINRSANRVLAARSQFSFGFDALGATVNDIGIDGRFTSWLGQFQVVQALGGGTILIARTGIQLTPDGLLPIEQFSIGGIDTVRGYQQNERVADNGIIGSLEVRYPIVRSPNGIGVIQLASFFDIGTVWNNQTQVPRELSSPSTLASVGLGLRWQLDPYVSAHLDWGIPLISVGDRGDSLQDNGISFSIRFQPF